LEPFFDVFRENVAKAVKLEPDRAFVNVVRTDLKASVVLGERGDRSGEERDESKREFFHWVILVDKRVNKRRRVEAPPRKIE
jgi:hypothetical protein